MSKYSIVWLRRDLRLEDNAALYHGLRSGVPIKPIFIFDENILSKLNAKDDARVTFLHNTVVELKSELKALGSDLQVYYDKPSNVWRQLVDDDDLVAAYVNRDYETYAIDRDSSVADMLGKAGKGWYDYKDQVIFDNDEVVKDNGEPYTVFTPYKRKWMAKLESRMESPLDQSYYFKSYPCEKYYEHLLTYDGGDVVELSTMGFERSAIAIPSTEVSQKLIKSYDQQRNFPAVDGTSKLGVHFRFGTVSIREKARKAQRLNDTYLSELVWRDFYSMILQHYPHVEDNSFREKYEAVPWRDAEADFQAWCEGRTGYPIVDAGMRELNTTGYMHNRVRMITASFLTKHLLIYWKKGERYFAEKLLDYDLASNSGGWQWAAGCGTDAAPYFRIFNPYTQATKFDKDRRYIKKWVPEVDTDSYPDPIVDHKEARERCLHAYKVGLGKI